MVTLFIIIALIIALCVVYYTGVIKNKETIKELESQKVDLLKEINYLQNELEAKTQSSNDTKTLLSRVETQTFLGQEDATFCIEDITKDGENYIITAYILETTDRILSDNEYNNLLNGKEIIFRNQKWKMSSQNEDRIFIQSGEDSLVVEKANKVITNAAGVDTTLCDYSNKKVSFAVSKDILIGEYWTNFEYDNNGQIRAYGMENTEEENQETTIFESISFERLEELSRGCQGTYDECVAYVKDGVVNAIRIKAQ